MTHFIRVYVHDIDPRWSNWTHFQPRIMVKPLYNWRIFLLCKWNSSMEILWKKPLTGRQDPFVTKKSGFLYWMIKYHIHREICHGGGSCAKMMVFACIKWHPLWNLSSWWGSGAKQGCSLVEVTPDLTPKITSFYWSSCIWYVDVVSTVEHFRLAVGI